MTSRPSPGASVARNLRFFGIAQLAVRVSGIATVVVMARLFSNADFGRYTVAVALASLLTLIVELGMGGYLVREATQRPERTGVVLGHILIIQFALGALALALCAGTAMVLGYDRETWTAVLLLAGGFVFAIASASCVAVLVAIDRPRAIAGFQIGQATALAAATLLALVAGLGPAGVAATVFAVSMLAFPVALVVLFRHWDGRVRFDRTGLSKTLRVGTAYSAARLGAVLLAYLDAVMVNAFAGNEATGLYGAAYRLLLVLMIVPLVYADAVTRLLADLAAADRAALGVAYRRVLRHMIMLGVPVAVGGALVAEPLVVLIFGEDFRAAAPAAALLLLGLAFAYANSLATATALAAGRERAVALIYGSAVALNAVLNVILIPSLGIEGAAVAMLAAQVWLVGWMVAACARAGLAPPPVGEVARVVVAAALMAAVVAGTRELFVPAAIAAGVIVYAAALLLVRALPDEDRRALGALLVPLAARRARS